MPGKRPNQWTITGDAMIRKKTLLIVFFLTLFVFQQAQASRGNNTVKGKISQKNVVIVNDYHSARSKESLEVLRLAQDDNACV